jgi:hypothetical protein
MAATHDNVEHALSRYIEELAAETAGLLKRAL